MKKSGKSVIQQGYGQTGPFAKAAGYDVVIEGEAGLMHMLVSLPAFFLS
jgi:crotonobetainyl-CoA:carnitine CoA-transferase CaiB-like acyl-CoA transferase